MTLGKSNGAFTNRSLLLIGIVALIVNSRANADTQVHIVANQGTNFYASNDWTITAGFSATMPDTPTTDYEFTLSGPVWTWTLLPTDSVASISPTNQQGTTLTAQSSTAMHRTYTLKVEVYWNETGMNGTPFQGQQKELGDTTDTISVNVTIVDENLLVTDPTWGASLHDTDDDDNSPNHPLSAGTRTQGSLLDDMGGIQFSMSNLDPTATYNWIIYNRFNGIPVGDDTVHNQPGSGQFNQTSNSGLRVYLPPGGYAIHVTKSDDDNFSRLINFDLIGVHFTFTAVPTTQPTTQPVSDEKVYGGYTMLDQSATATTQPTSPTGSSNASVVLEGPPDVQGTWKLNIPSSVAFWQVNPGSPDTPVGNGQASATVTLAPTVPLKMQGLTASSSERDTSLKCTFTESSPTSFTMYDTAKATVASLEVLDAKAFSPNVNGTIDGDPVTGSGGPIQMTGAWADGLSVLVERMKPNVNAAVPITLQAGHTNPNFIAHQSSDYVGSIDSVFPTLPCGGPSTAASLNATQAKVFYYCPPGQFLFAYSDSQQNIAVSATLGGLNSTPAVIKLTRPTVVLTHGFNSGPAALKTLSSYLVARTPGLKVHIFDWKHINLDGVDTVATSFSHDLRATISAVSANGIAATRADVYGHSMGGEMAWWYMSNFGATSFSRAATPARAGETYTQPFNWNADGSSVRYLVAGNFGKGDVRCFITSGTPYLGSPWANYAYDYYSRPQAVALCGLMGARGDGNCFADMRVDGLAFSGLFFWPGIGAVPGYPNPVVSMMLPAGHYASTWTPIVGIAGDQGVGEVAGAFSPIIGAFVDLFENPALLGITNTNSDWVVESGSQSNGLASAPEVQNVVHTDEDANNDVDGIVAYTLGLQADPAYISP
jgi:pimeloyl-ACP methyl ester carboxylesterase